jgi:hypothetical protein
MCQAAHIPYLVSVADPDLGSCAFLTLDPDPPLIPNLGSQIPISNPIFFRA